jgi:hypothetical protein
MVPAGLKGPFTAYTIVRGHENLPVQVAGYVLPPGVLLKVHTMTEVVFP